MFKVLAALPHFFISRPEGFKPGDTLRRRLETLRYGGPETSDPESPVRERRQMTRFMSAPAALSFESPTKVTEAKVPPKTVTKRRRVDSHRDPEKNPYPVAPGLFVGCMGSSQNRKALTDIGITHIVRIANSQSSIPEQSQFEDIQYHPFVFGDRSDVSILGHISTAYADLLPLLINGKATLIHCEMGKSRSASMAIGVILHLFYSGQMAPLAQFADLQALLSKSQDPVMDLFRQISTTRMLIGNTIFPDIMAPNPSFMAQLELIPLMYQPPAPGMGIEHSFIQNFWEWDGFYRDPSRSGFNPDQVVDLDLKLNYHPLGLQPLHEVVDGAAQKLNEAFLAQLTKDFTSQ
jgi:predicted protein tyrosine phosphatase